MIYLETDDKNSLFFYLVIWCLIFDFHVKSALSGLTEFLANESPLETMKNVFYFTLKAIFHFEILKFLFWIFGQRLNEKDKVNFKSYNMSSWITNNYNTHIATHIKK